MKINIELNTKDIANAKQESIRMITTALQAIAQADEATPVPETPVSQEQEHKTEPNTITCQSDKAEAEHTPEFCRPNVEAESKSVPKPKQATKVKPEKNMEEPKEEPKDAADTDTEETAPAVDRQTVQNRLKEIAKAGKAKGIKEILTKRNVRKFSELPDEDLADVLKEAEAL